MCGTARPPEGMSAIEWIPVSGRCERGAGSTSAYARWLIFCHPRPPRGGYSSTSILPKKILQPVGVCHVPRVLQQNNAGIACLSFVWKMVASAIVFRWIDF